MMEANYRGGSLHIVLDKRFNGIAVRPFLMETLQLPEGFIRSLFAQRAVRIGSSVVNPEDILPANARMVLTVPDTVGQSRENLAERYGDVDSIPPVDVLYEDDHVLVVNKLSGMIVHSDVRRERTLDAAVAMYYLENGIRSPILHAHRLDKPTTGAVVYAKHAFMARALDAQFANRQMSRQYLAIVSGAELIKNQVIDLAIARDRHRAGYFRVSSTGKPARTHVDVQASTISSDLATTLVKLSLETGRTHQIRVHMAALGAPILGDIAYGATRRFGSWPSANQISLHAVQATFFHPYDETNVRVVAPLDDGWQMFLRKEWGIDDICALGG